MLQLVQLRHQNISYPILLFQCWKRQDLVPLKLANVQICHENKKKKKKKIGMDWLKHSTENKQHCVYIGNLTGAMVFIHCVHFLHVWSVRGDWSTCVFWAKLRWSGDWLTQSLIYSFMHARTNSVTHTMTGSLIHSLTHLPTKSFTHSLTHSLTNSLSFLLTHSFIHPFTHLSTNSLTYQLTHARWLADYLTHSPPHSCTHSLTHSCMEQKELTKDHNII